MSVFNFITQLASFKQLHTHIDRILRLVYSIKFHQIFMVELPHDFDLVYQRLFSFLLTVTALLRKGLHCILFRIFIFDYQIN